MSSFDVTVRSPGLRRRRLVQNVFAVIATLSAVAAVTMLGIVLGSVISKGASSLSVDFFTKPRGLFGEPGGIADAIIGSCLIVAMATLIAVPIGVLVAIYVSEFATKSVGTFVRVVLDVMNGIPAIVVGIFVFGVVVAGRGQSALAGAFALSILMVPMVARATQEVLSLVPGGLREASLALGVSRLADRLRRRAPDRGRRHRHRQCPRRRTRRGRDGAAPLHLLDHGERDQLRRARGAAHDPGGDLCLLRVARPPRAGARVDGGAGA